MLKGKHIANGPPDIQPEQLGQVYLFTGVILIVMTLCVLMIRLNDDNNNNHPTMRITTTKLQQATIRDIHGRSVSIHGSNHLLLLCSSGEKDNVVSIVNCGSGSGGGTSSNTIIDMSLSWIGFRTIYIHSTI
jgi:hypothetical protein